jgi:hypothetical protein
LSIASLLRSAALLAALALAAPADAQQAPQVPPAVASLARAIAAELVMQCPLSDADDASAFEGCRTALGEGSVLRAALPERVLWGREAAADAALRQSSLTQLAPEVWTRLYAPLFMFNGNHRVEWMAAENQFVIRLEAAFRNRLPQGLFPYPFWHEQATWRAYQNTNGLLLWVQPQTARVHVAQFTDQASTPALQEVRPVAHRFDGRWMWTDAGGRMQPAAAHFDGLYRPGNPYRDALDRQYRDLALQLHESRCSACHTPASTATERPLVLLSSAAHVTGEIDRLVHAVREARLDAAPFPHALTAEDRQWLLVSAEAFRETVRAARRWEREARSSL